jgi:hypothetical protein
LLGLGSNNMTIAAARPAHPASILATAVDLASVEGRLAALSVA